MNASRFSEAQKAFTLKQGADGMLSEPCFAAKAAIRKSAN
jgi:hypothetical protein